MKITLHITRRFCGYDPKSPRTKTDHEIIIEELHLEVTLEILDGSPLYIGQKLFLGETATKLGISGARIKDIDLVPSNSGCLQPLVLMHDVDTCVHAPKGTIDEERAALKQVLESPQVPETIVIRLAQKP